MHATSRVFSIQHRLTIRGLNRVAGAAESHKPVSGAGIVVGSTDTSNQMSKPYKDISVLRS